MACDGGDQPEATVSPAARESPQPSLTQTPQTTPDETPEPTPAETAEAEDTPSTSEGEARRAVVAADQAGFLGQFADVMIVGKTCDYDPDTGLVDCGADGLYQLEEGVQGSDAVCRVILVDDQPVGLNCQTEEPLQAAMYEIE